MKPVKAILLTGLLVGTVDGIAAIVHFKLSGGGNPILISKYIASGIFGPSAFQGGTGMVLSGTLFHFVIATTWTALFFLIYPRISGKHSNQYVSGVLYGLLIWTVMNLIVLPLSAAPPASRNLVHDSIGMTILVMAVGLPIALMQRKAAKALMRRTSEREAQ